MSALTFRKRTVLCVSAAAVAQRAGLRAEVAEAKRSGALAVNVGGQFPKMMRSEGFPYSIGDFAADVSTYF